MERLIYASRAVWPAPSQAMEDILRVSVPANAGAEITGALGHSDQTYVQLLEGPAEALDALMEKLMADPRHEDLRVLSREAVARRMLPTWTMARADLVQHKADVARLLEAGDAVALMALLASLVHLRQTSTV